MGIDDVVNSVLRHITHATNYLKKEIRSIYSAHSVSSESEDVWADRVTYRDSSGRQKNKIIFTVSTGLTSKVSYAKVIKLRREPDFKGKSYIDIIRDPYLEAAMREKIERRLNRRFEEES